METGNSQRHFLKNTSMPRVNMIYRGKSSKDRSFIKHSDTFSKQRLLAKMVDHPEEGDDSYGDEEFLDTFLKEYFYANSKYDLQGKKQ